MDAAAIHREQQDMTVMTITISVSVRNPSPDIKARLNGSIEQMCDDYQRHLRTEPDGRDDGDNEFTVLVNENTRRSTVILELGL